MQIAETAIPRMTSNQFEKYCEKVRNELWDETKLTSAVNQAGQVLDGVLLGNYDRDKAKDSTIQDQAKTMIQSQQNSLSNQ
jgi:phage gp36-like protein